jgi:hypothetical protein
MVVDNNYISCIIKIRREVRKMKKNAGVLIEIDELDEMANRYFIKSRIEEAKRIISYYQNEVKELEKELSE